MVIGKIMIIKKGGKMEKRICYRCKGPMPHPDEDTYTGCCVKCTDEGWWVDPAGGLQCGNDDDYDPAAMYE